jgi:Rieske Fe-S protein
MIERRAFFYRLIGGIGATIAGLLAVPIAGPTLSPLFEKRGKRGLAEVGPVSRFAEGEPTLAALTVEVKGEVPFQQGVYVVNRGGGRYDIFKLNCTHLGCPYSWNQAARGFFCPCHGGVYDDRGNVTGGPPPRALDRYEAVVKGDMLFAGDLDEAPGKARA